MKHSEQQLVELLKQGNSSAVREWFTAYHHELLNFVSYKVSAAQDAEEIVQETFIICLKNVQLFQGNASLATWMKSVAHHEVADYYRKKYAKKAIHTLSLHHLVLSEKIDDAHEVSEKVKQVLGAMRNDYRELLLSKYVDGKTVKMIAAELGKTVKSVEADLFRARQNFKELYVIQAQ